jgi:hypothetical protein
MKTILAAMMVFASTLVGADLANGVFYVDGGVDCVLVTQAGGNATNRLEAGKTYQTGNAVLELTPTNATAFFFSGAPLVQVGSNSSFAVLSFDQEVENLNANPQKAKFGAHTLNLQLVKGEFCIVYSNKDATSRVNVSTHYADYELSGGKYYFRVGKSAMVYVLEGGMIVHSDKNRADVVEKGNLALAVPFTDAESGLEDKFVTSFKKAKQDEMEKFAAPVLMAERRLADVEFFVIGGKVIGFQIK